jgi:putative exporter of polyketide antibiotics
VFGDQVSDILVWLGRRRAILMIVPAAILAIVAYRLWRRRRYGAARLALGPPSPEHRGQRQ